MSPNRTLAALLLGLIVASSPARAAGLFADPALEKAVRDALKLDDKAELKEEKLQDLYILEAAAKPDKPETVIKDLAGLEKCKNLALLNLARNKVSNLAPLKELVNIQSLDLSENEITDVAPLAGLVKLQYLMLNNNQIQTIEPLKGLVAMQALDVSANKLTDLAPVAGLVKLASLYMAKNQIKDLGPLVTAAKADAQGMKRWAPYLRLYLAGNPLSDAAKGEQLGALKAIGVRIEGT